MSETPSKAELQAALAWLQLAAESDSSPACRCAKGALKAALGRTEWEQDGDIDSVAVFDSAYPIPDQASALTGQQTNKRRRVKDSRFCEYFNSRAAHRIGWLRNNRPEIGADIEIREVGSDKGGSGVRKHYLFLRRPFVESEAGNSASQIAGTAVAVTTGTDVEIDAEPPVTDGLIVYERSDCTTEEMTWWGRFLFGNGPVESGSWRWKLLVSRFLLMFAAGGLSILLLVLLPTLLGRGPGLTGILTAAGCVAFVYWFEIRNVVRITNDRIAMAGGNIVEGIVPAQLEIRRHGEKREWALVRYSSTCPVCVSPLHVCPGEPDFPRRLVGRCDESPREHVFSFDRVTRKGRALLEPPTH